MRPMVVIQQPRSASLKTVDWSMQLRVGEDSTTATVDTLSRYTTINIC